MVDSADTNASTSVVETPVVNKTGRNVVLLMFIGVITLVLVTYFFAFTHNDIYPAFKGIRVEQSVDSAPSGLKIGIVVSYTEDPWQGAGWDGNGEGVTIAKWRLAQAGIKVDTVVVSDQGSDAGSNEAITKLKEAGVVGVVALTSGSHTNALARSANLAGIPIIFPYQMAPEQPVKNTWYGLTQSINWINKFQKELSGLGCAPVVLIGQPMPGLAYSEVISDSNPQQLISAVDKRLKGSIHGCVVLNDTSNKMIENINSLQAVKAQFKLIVGSGGANTDFIQKLSQADYEGQSIYTLFTPTQISSSHSQVGFREAQSLMAANRNIESLRKDERFSKRYTLADMASYESFFALIKASSQAKSSDPLKVAESLSSLKISSTDSVDGVVRDYSKPVYQEVSLVQLMKIDGSYHWIKVKN